MNKYITFMVNSFLAKMPNNTMEERTAFAAKGASTADGRVCVCVWRVYKQKNETVHPTSHIKHRPPCNHHNYKASQGKQSTLIVCGLGHRQILDVPRNP